MKISKGVEWAAHAATLMAAIPEGKALRADALARFHQVPAAYMAKQLQALSTAGIVKASRGARGGYRLAKPATEINLEDIFNAVEGRKRAFQCMEIRQNGPCPARAESCHTPCGIASSFHAAETAFRDTLRNITVSDLALQAIAGKTPEEIQATMNWIMEEAVTL